MKFVLYNLICFFRGIPLRIYFERVFVDGREQIPRDKPILFIANHSASFIDGMVINFFSGRSVFPLARGDAFRRPIYRKMLRSMRILPIFRSTDADVRTARSGNEQTYQECYQLFGLGEAILIFPEASSEPLKTLRPLRKGAGNIAAHAMMHYQGELDLYVVPCGINMSGFSRRRVRLQLGIGAPWRMSTYWEEIQVNPRSFGAQVTEAFEARLRDLTVKTEGEQKEERELLHEMLLNECDPGFGLVVDNSGADLIAARMDGATQRTLEKVAAYGAELKREGLEDLHVKGRPVRFFSLLLCAMSAPIGLPAALLAEALWMVAWNWAGRTSPKPRFLDSIYLGIGFLLTFLWYPLVGLILWITLPDHWHVAWKWAAFAVAIGMLPSWQVVRDEVRRSSGRIRFSSLRSHERNALRQLREEILSAL